MRLYILQQVTVSYHLQVLERLSGHSGLPKKKLVKFLPLVRLEGLANFIIGAELQRRHVEDWWSPKKLLQVVLEMAEFDSPAVVHEFAVGFLDGEEGFPARSQVGGGVGNHVLVQVYFRGSSFMEEGYCRLL